MTIYVRLPPTLKAAIEHAAAQAGQSVNTWMMRAAEEKLREMDGSFEVARID